ncbi:MAG: glycosyltransferase family 2 protein [Spirochaetes bacterium]|nr:glycosyltransferase family 2 protein [Spirochaetota bacterium]
MPKDKLISGFSTVRNGIKLGYPLIESIHSVLPVVDEFVITVGKSEDNTLESIRKIGSKKIRIIETVWDPRFTVKGRILAVQSNIALFQCTGWWAFYIQADEVFHEKDQNRLVSLCEKFRDDDDVEGMLFDYTHFFGNYDWYGDSYNWYRKEIRLIRNHRGISSWRSAQSFRVDGRKINVIDSGARIFHYGWVRSPEVMAEKRRQHDELHHGKGFLKDVHASDYSYLNEMDTKCMKRFTGEHPAVMKKKVAEFKNDFNPSMVDYKPNTRDIRRRIQDRIGKISGYYPGEYRNYRLLKDKV